MADTGRFLARLLPARIRREVFEPALNDLRIDELRKGQTLLRGLRLSFRSLVLFLDCWRVTVLPARTPWTASLPRDGRPTSRKGMVMHMWQDIRQAIRRLARERSFTTAAVLTLTLGVGANVAVFAVVEAVLLRPLPYVKAADLVILNHRDERTGITKEFIAIGDFIDLAARQKSLEALTAYNFGRVTAYTESEPTVVNVLQAEPRFFDMLHVGPAHGRFFGPNDARQGAAPVVILSHSFWQTTFKGDLGAIGRRIRTGTVDREIIGVAPPGFRFPANERTDLIFPMTIPAEPPAERKSTWVFAAGRLKPGASTETVAAELTALSQRMEQEHPSANQGSRYFIRSLRDALVGDTKRPLTLLAFAVAAVLLIACANVGNLLLVRALGRQQEMAVRAALGASRSRMAGQVFAESLVLAVVAAAGGIAVAYWGTPALIALVPRSVNAPGLAEAGLNWQVLAFALGISITAALIFGLVSAVTTGRPATATLVSQTRAGVSRHVRRLTSGLVVVEIALAVVLLLGAGLILRSFAALMSVDPGFDVDRVATFAVSIPAARYPDVPARAAFFQRALAAARAVPGVEAVGAAAVTPLTGNNWTVGFQRIDKPVPAGERPPDVGWQNASGGYFAALGIPVKSGRVFDDRDGPGSAPVVIVSESIERRFFSGQSAVGHFVNNGQGPAEIVGVVGDIRRAALSDEPRADMYFPYERQPGYGITIFARTSGDPAAALPALKTAFRQLEPNAVFVDSGTLAETAAQSVGTTRLTLWLLGVFALIALALAGVGIYGVLSHAVRQRTREIGTRLALGARPADILLLVMRWGAILALAGVTLGAAAGLLAARALETMLYGVTTTDPRALITAAVILITTALAASFIPARRAAKTDPARTLAT